MNIRAFIFQVIYHVSRPVLSEPLFFLFMYILGTFFISIKPDYPPFYYRLYGELFLDVYILSFFLSLFSKRIRIVVKIFIVVFLYLLSCIDFFCLNRLQTYITPSIIGLVMETNSSEASEFLNAYISLSTLQPNIIKTLILAFLHFVLFLLLIQRKQQILNINKKSIFCIFRKYIHFIIISFLFASVLIAYPNKKRIYAIFSQKSIKDTELLFAKDYWAQRALYLPIYRLAFSMYEIYLSKQQLNILKYHSQHLASKIKECTYTSDNIVLIIGESYNKHHSQLYGYNLVTTPMQMNRLKEGELFLFTDVVTPHNLTSEVFKDLFSMNDVSKHENWYEKPLFTQYFKSAGYNVLFITNQYVPSSDNNMFDFSGGTILNDKYMSSSQFSHRNTQMHELDEDLLNDYDSLRSFSSIHNLIIFHLIGQHVDYCKRFPSKYRQFNITDYDRRDLNPKERQVVADYDNATYYNDYVIDNIIKLFENDDAIIICTADHGEECYDQIKTFGRSHGTINSVIARNEFEVPFWIWCSPKYKEKHPQICEFICNSCYRPISTDDIGHLLLYLAGIKCKDYKESKNPILPTYFPNNKRLLKNSIDYDEIMLNGAVDSSLPCSRRKFFQTP